MLDSVQKIYGEKIRLRVCGLLAKEDALLMVNHRGLSASHFWAPPGGGIDFGESAPQALAREVREETGLKVEVRDFLFACEFIKEPLHAVELFFLMELKGGTLKVGKDPESGDNQIISEVAFLKWNQITSLPAKFIHGIFQKIEKPEEITLLRGYFKL